MSDFDVFNKQIQVSLAAALNWGDGKLYTGATTRAMRSWGL